MSYLNESHSPRAVAASTPEPAPHNLAPGDAAAGREFAYRGYVMHEVEEWDGDGFSTPAFIAWRPSSSPRGEALYLRHPRFRFTPTREWFEREVDYALDGAA